MKAALGFILLALAGGALVGVTRIGTSATIEANYIAAETAILSELLGNQLDPAAAARVCRTEVRGYAGIIRLLVLPQKTHPATAGIPEFSETNDSIDIAAVRVISHTETPGIGDFIERRNSNWILGFNNAALDELNTKLDAVTGATITRRAVIKGVRQACQS